MTDDVVRSPDRGDAAFVTLSTVVHCHNRLGRVYLFAIGPFHRLIVQSGLRRAARRGWPVRVDAVAAPID